MLNWWCITFPVGFKRIIQPDGIRTDKSTSTFKQYLPSLSFNFHVNHCEGIMTIVKGTSSWYWSAYKSFTFPRPSISLLNETKGSQSRGAQISVFKHSITVIVFLQQARRHSIIATPIYLFNCL
jgi:hypothetical protein